MVEQYRVFLQLYHFQTTVIGLTERWSSFQPWQWLLPHFLHNNVKLSGLKFKTRPKQHLGTLLQTSHSPPVRFSRTRGLRMPQLCASIDGKEGRQCLSAEYRRFNQPDRAEQIILRAALSFRTTTTIDVIKLFFRGVIS
jgi:hypothetical protein